MASAGRSNVVSRRTRLVPCLMDRPRYVSGERRTPTQHAWPSLLIARDLEAKAMPCGPTCDSWASAATAPSTLHNIMPTRGHLTTSCLNMRHPTSLYIELDALQVTPRIGAMVSRRKAPVCSTAASHQP